MKCYKVLFSIKGIKKNYGSYSLIPIILLHIILIFLFYGENYYKIIKDKINDIKYAIINWYLVKNERRNNKKIKRKGKIISKTERDKEVREKRNSLNNRLEIVKPIPININNMENINNNKDNPPNKRHKSIQININNQYKNNIINTNNNKLKKKNLIDSKNTMITELKNKEIIQKTKQIMSYNDEELNNLDYKEALKYDKRTYCQYYISLLKTKHIIMLTFFNYTDYNSKIIKIDLFLFNFSLYYVVNAFFFNDNTMHKIYEDKGNFNFIYQLPNIIYSSIISIIFNTLLKLLALSERLILNYKKNKNKENLDNRINNLETKLRYKFILYFIISTIFFLFFWYYLSMFCAIYANTQIHLIKDTIISFGLSLCYPFAINIFPGIFRIYSLSDKKIKRKLLYGFSKILQFI